VSKIRVKILANPVLVEVLRGDIVESEHRGAVVVADAAGRIVLEIGDTDRPVFPRSAVKSIQALPLVESGAADAFGFGDRELALACASHGGEPAHAEMSASMLARAGLDGSALECGWHWPSHHASTLALARLGGTPNALHNNCSGKHSGFVCTCRHLGVDHRGYVTAGHLSQELVREAMQSVTGAAHDEENSAIDGCSIPTYAVPLRSLALGFARMATGAGMSALRAKAACRLLAACMAEPFYVAGTDRADTRLMKTAPGRIFVKIGAEGVFCAALPELGLGIALKAGDGGERAAEVMVAAVLARLLTGDAGLSATLAAMARPSILSRKGVAVGSIRPSEALS
jgi:L-asparaginase II